MVAGEVHSSRQIEAVRAKPLHAAIEMKLPTVRRTGISYQPVEKRLAVPTRTMRGIRDQIVHVEHSPPCQGLEHAKASDGAHIPGFTEEGKLVAPLLLTAHAGKKIDLSQVGTQLRQHRKTIADFGIRTRQSDEARARRAASLRTAW